MTTKNILLDNNSLFRRNPSLYSVAIGYSLKTELPVDFFVDLADIRARRAKNMVVSDQILD